MGEIAKNETEETVVHRAEVNLLKTDLIRAGQSNLVGRMERLEKKVEARTDTGEDGDALMAAVAEIVSLQRAGKIDSTEKRKKRARGKLGLAVKAD